MTVLFSVVQRLGYVYFKESPWFRSVNEHLFYISGSLTGQCHEIYMEFKSEHVLMFDD